MESLRNIQQQADRWFAAGGFYPLNMLMTVTSHFGKLQLGVPRFFTVAHDVQPNLHIVIIMLIRIHHLWLLF